MSNVIEENKNVNIELTQEDQKQKNILMMLLMVLKKN